MMPHNMFLTDSQKYDWEMRYKSSKLGSRVTIMPRFESQAMVYNIMSQVHCGVFPARAEGWNLEALEILACGRHLIITDCTAHSEYANKDNSYLINMTSGYEKAKDYVFFDGKSEWRSFGDDEFDQLVEYLRLVHKKNIEGSLKINKSGIETSKQFTWKKSSLILDSTLRKLCNANT
jgi:glycosyltransferase involved in cell wall biosynthesis